MFNWNQGRPKNSGANSTIRPKAYQMISDDFGQETAEQYLALCKSITGALTGVTIFSETAEASKFRKGLDW